MSNSYTGSNSTTFTDAHARHLASKVAADLKRMQRFYGSPSDSRIAEFQDEAIILMKLGYLKDVIYGFRKDGEWIKPSLKYTAKEIAQGGIDNDPGKIPPNLDVYGASFHSFLTYTDAWFALPDASKAEIEATLPIQRTYGTAPTVKNGYFEVDNSYAAGGRELSRATIRSY